MDLGATQVELATGVSATIVETAPGVYTIANSPTSTGLIRIGALIVEPGEAPTLAIPVAADSIGTVMETLDDLISASPGTLLADIFQDAINQLAAAERDLS